MPATRRTRLMSIAAGGCATVLLASGCSGDSSEESTKTDTTTTTQATRESSPAADGAPTKEEATAVLLEDADVPGFTAFPDDQVAAELEQASAVVEQAASIIEVQPPECQQGFTDQLSAAGQLSEIIDKGAVRVFQGQSQTVLTQSILPSELFPDLGATEQYVQQCSQMTISAAGVTGTATMTPVDLQLGDRTIGVVTVLDVGGGGSAQQIISGNVAIEDGDTVISLSLADNDGGSPDELTAALTAAAEAAYAKAEPILN